MGRFRPPLAALDSASGMAATVIRRTHSGMASREGLLERERPGGGGWGVHILTRRDTRTGHRNHRVAPVHGLEARFGIGKSGGRGTTQAVQRLPPPPPCMSKSHSRAHRPRGRIRTSGSATAHGQSAVKSGLRKTVLPAIRTPRDPPSGGVRGRGHRHPSLRGGASRWVSAHGHGHRSSNGGRGHGRRGDPDLPASSPRGASGADDAPLRGSAGAQPRQLLTGTREAWPRGVSAHDRNGQEPAVSASRSGV